MKILFISNLFPDQSDPVRGLDNATLLHHLKAECQIRVISPRSKRFTPSSQFLSRVEDREFAPLFSCVNYIPRLGSRWNDRLMERGLAKPFFELVEKWKPDVVLCSWLYPDGCAIARLCEKAELPLLLITQGSDTHQYLENETRRRKIVDAIKRAALVICRSGDLSSRLASAGVPASKLEVIYNGVNESDFHPIDRELARKELALSDQSPTLLFVGNLLPVKNPQFLLKAHAELNKRRKEIKSPPSKLFLIGTGPLSGKIEAAATELGTSDFVELLGRCSPQEINLWMNAADVFCLTSQNEGFPNVLLEAMACRLPIVSTDVGGIREKVSSPSVGYLVEAGDVPGYVAALERVLQDGKMRPTEGAEFDLSWENTARKYLHFLQESTELASCSRSVRT